MSRRKQSGEVLYRVKHKDGFHIASSNKTPGRFRTNLLDDETNKPDGFAELEPVDDSEFEYDYSYDYDENQQDAESSTGMQLVANVVAGVLSELTIYAMEEYVAPKVKLWLQSKAIPTIEERWKNLTDKTKNKPSPIGKKKSKLNTNEIVSANEIDQGLISHELEEKHEKYLNDMTSEEAQKELLDIFILSVILIKKIRKLSNARIINNDGTQEEYLKGQDFLEKLTNPEYINSINRILANNPQLLEEKKTDLSVLLGHNWVNNRQFVPIETGKLKELLSPHHETNVEDVKITPDDLFNGEFKV